jgi:alcohol dehydrogenase class IV
MWYFSSPNVVFGEGSLAHLETLRGERAFIVTDENLARLGYPARICQALEPTGMVVEIYTQVEPDPTIECVEQGAVAMRRFQPDWIIALGGGSVMDAAKAMWVLYERPDISAEEINPIEPLGLREKARLVAVPTTAGTGSEATWAIVLTDPAEMRKLGLGSRENLPDFAILDPELILQLPPRLTADTALDALTHAIEGYTSALRNDFSDGLCLKAAQLVFDYLPAAYHDGSDIDARTRLQNAAAIAGLGFGNSMAALAHGMGHALGGVLHVPHGRAVALFLPYTIEYCARGEPGSTRYAELAAFLGLAFSSGEDRELSAALALARAVRDLQREVGQPLTIPDCGIDADAFERDLDRIVENALNDSQTVMSSRVPDTPELRRLFWAAFRGGAINF